MEWFIKIENQIREQIKDTREKDQRFFRIDEFIRMTKRTDEFASTCKECNSFKNEIDGIADKIKDAVTHTGKARKSYDRLLGNLSTHMRKQHGFYPPYHHTYSYSLLGTSIATAFAFLISYLFPETDQWFFIIPAFVIGLLFSNLLGAKKDSTVRNNNKLL